MRLIKQQIIEIAFVDRHLIRKSCLLNVYGSDYLLFGSAMIHMFVLLGPIAWYKYIYIYITSQKFKLLKKNHRFIAAVLFRTVQNYKDHTHHAT